jgi:Peptidase family S41
MLTASALLRDPHAVLCYTMNSRGGFTPHDVLEFVADHDRYPGYLLSREDKMTTVRQLHRDLGPTSGLVQPQQAILASPPSSFASIREQKVTRGIHSVSTTTAAAGTLGYNHDYTTYSGLTMSQYHHHRAAQKKIVILVNEGTASAAEVFASALHDNGRTVALVGTRTYGKGYVLHERLCGGYVPISSLLRYCLTFSCSFCPLARLIQHTFPLPDGGGLRLTVAEYLTPGLRHVTNVGGAQYNQVTGDWVGGGINPDLYCESKQGIPSNIGADLCVGVALDALQEEASSSALDASSRALLQHW